MRVSFSCMCQLIIFLIIFIEKDRIMGNCVNQPKTQARGRGQFSKIRQQIINSEVEFSNYQQIAQKDAYETLRKQINYLPGRQVGYDNFIQMFPTFSKYSDITKKKFFSIFSNNQNSIHKKDLLLGIVIFQQAPSNILIKTIFSLYADNKMKQLQNRSLFQKQLKRFTKQNKEFIINAQGESLQNQRIQLQHILENYQFITFSMFQSYVKKYYSIKKFKRILQWDLSWKEKQLVETIKKYSPFDFKISQPVYLVEYQWFLSWKNYMKNKYQCDIEFQRLRNSKYNQPKDQQRSAIRDKQSIEKIQRSVQIKPKQIKNTPLQGFYSNTLKRGLKQFRDYVFLPQSIWQPLYYLYPGGPIFKRSYPQIYSMTVIQVYVNQFGYFKPSIKTEAIHFSENRKGKYKIQEVFLKDSFYQKNKAKIETFVCFIKPQGKLQWTIIQNLEDDLGNYLTRHRTYLCFVPRNLKSIFEGEYNCIIEQKKRKIKNRIANYGSLIQISKADSIQRAYVIDIPNKEHVVIDYQNEEGYQSKTIKIATLKSLNPQIIQQQLSQQQFVVGLQNLGNTCYINSVLQCLIATPCFGQYLQKQYSKIQDYNAIANQVYQIFDRSRKSKNNIDTNKLKEKIDFWFPLFRGYSQQDAQQFLINLLTKIQQEINFEDKKTTKNLTQEQQYYTNNYSTIRISKESSNQINRSVIMDKKIKKRQTIQYSNQQDKFRYFSGMTETETICTKCMNKGKIQKQYFFTYSVSLPEHTEKEYYFIFVPKLKQRSKNWSPIEYGFTASKSLSFKDFVAKMSEVLNISKDKLFAIPVINGEWRDQFYENQKQKQINQFLNFGMKIVCYEVIKDESPTSQQYQDRQWNGKTAKIQVRQRYYQNKSNAYTSFSIPLLVEVQEATEVNDIYISLKDLLQQENIEVYSQNKGSIKLNGKAEKELRGIQSLINNKEQNQQQANQQSQQNKLEVQNEENEKISTFIDLKQEQKSDQGKQKKQIQDLLISKYYKIRLIKKDNYSDNSCFICSKKFSHGQNINSDPYFETNQKECSGCILQKAPVNNYKFTKNINKIAFVIDWENHIVATVNIKKHESYDICDNRAKNRKDKIKDLLEDQFFSKEQLQLKCQVNNCLNNRAFRMEKLAKYPNIFILHLKRFRFFEDCFMKLTNPVSYEQKLTINNQNYELYGVITHSGSGTGGHYIAYVKDSRKWYKCDDERITAIKDSEIINPQAYLLFYKKVSFIPTFFKVHF